MKTTITFTLRPEDLLGHHGSPTESPLAKAMSRETGHTFRHVGRILYTVDETTDIAQVYNLGPDGQMAWRDWCKGYTPSQDTFIATLLPQVTTCDAVIAYTHNETDPPRRLDPPNPLNPGTLQPAL